MYINYVIKETYPLVVDIFPVNCFKERMLHDFLSIVGTTTKAVKIQNTFLILVVVTNDVPL